MRIFFTCNLCVCAYIGDMSTNIKYIRKQVFKKSQAEFAALIGRTQSTVSRWEGGTPLTITDLQAIREAAKQNRIKGFSDDLFFEPPKGAA